MVLGDDLLEAGGLSSVLEDSQGWGQQPVNEPVLSPMEQVPECRATVLG